MARLRLAVKQIKQARHYSLRLLEHTDPELWFRRPAEGVTHIAWQVGHLAVAEYRLALERIRGRRPHDDRLIADDFLSRFRRESVPDPDPGANPDAAALVEVLDRVHQQVLRELEDLADEELDRPPLVSHPLFGTKLGSLLWCAQHEMLHAGQIGLLRRLLGQPPLW